MTDGGRPVGVSRRTVMGVVAQVPLVGLASLTVAQEPGPPRERVQGIGGFFFRANDPKRLAAWYRDHLGLALAPTSYDAAPWRTEAGITVFAPFERDTDYFGDQQKPWMINFRVRDLDAMASQLRAGGVTVDVDPQAYPNGRFAKLTDPEGNPIQLWQPAA